MAVSNLTIKQGSTFTNAVRWETLPVIYKAITAITKAAPAQVTAPSHGLPPGWRVSVQSVKGMTQINADNVPPRSSDMQTVSVIDTDNVTLDDIDSSMFNAYTSGGYLRFYTPTDLNGFTARMSIKDKIGGTELLRLDTDNGRVQVDNTTKTITLTIDATDTALIDWAKGVYDLELVSPLGVVTTLLHGSVTVVKEVTST